MFATFFFTQSITLENKTNLLGIHAYLIDGVHQANLNPKIYNQIRIKMVLFTDTVCLLSSNPILDWLLNGFSSKLSGRYGQVEAFSEAEGFA